MPKLNPVILSVENRSKGSKYHLSPELMHANVMHTLEENAAAVIHELRNPLQTIRAYLQLLERGLQKNSESSHYRHFEQLYNEISRMDSILSQYLHLSRMAPTELLPLNLAVKISELVPFLRSMAVVRGINMEAEMIEDLPLVLCDEQQIKRLLLNLFVNACDACTGVSEAKVIIQLYAEDGDLVLNAIDNGCGIPKEKLEKIWNPFYTNKASGTGLGLPSCARIAAEHGGSLTVISEPGQGSCFSLRLRIMS